MFDEHGEERDVSLVHEINEYMISRDIKKIVIPNGETSIGSFAFCGCTKLTNVTIPNSVTCIEFYAFYDCSRLKSVTIGNNVKNIGVYAFLGCDDLKSLIFKNKTIDQVKSMKYYPFGIVNKSIIKCQRN